MVDPSNRFVFSETSRQIQLETSRSNSTIRTLECGILNRALPVLDPLLPADNNSIRNRDLGLAIHLCAT